MLRITTNECKNHEYLNVSYDLNMKLTNLRNTTRLYLGSQCVKDVVQSYVLCESITRGVLVLEPYKELHLDFKRILCKSLKMHSPALSTP